MGAFIIAGIIALGTFLLALLTELARGMATAPSMHPSHFWPIMCVGIPIAAMVAATHWLPNIGW